MKIKKVIKKKFKGVVYNFHCTPDENYFSEGILVHNCYKANNPNGENMTFETFKKVFHNLPDNITQIAFGVDAQCESNPDTFKIMEYCRENGVIPNVTVADISKKTAKKLATVCGAVAVSRYEDKNYCYDSIKKLSDAGLKQVNMHIMASKETLPWIMETFQDFHKDSRLKGLNAIVLLSLKKRGRGTKYNSLNYEQFKAIVTLAFGWDVPLGFDSCSCNKFIDSIRTMKIKEDFRKQLEMMAEPCESSLFSVYVNTHGEFFPCSFCEGIGKWKTGIDMADDNFTFMKDLWFTSRVTEFRNGLIQNIDNNGVRSCPMFEV